MSQHKQAQTEELLRVAAESLLARAADAYALDASALLPRLRASVEKYVLRDEPGASEEEIRGFVERLHADELVLVAACERGDERAWSALMEGYRTTVVSAARGASASEAEADELAQSVWAELYGLRQREDGSLSGKLAYYSGCGSLGGWLRAVVGQLAVDRHRRTSRLVQTEEDADFDRLASEDNHEQDGFRVAIAPDPERALAEAEVSRAVTSALRRAVGELDAEARLLVKLYYFDELRLREAGAVLGVHEATASRRLSRAHAEIRKSVEAHLAGECGWGREEVARAIREVAAHLETGLAQALTTRPVEEAASDKKIG